MDATTDRVIEYFISTQQMEGKSSNTVEWYEGMLGQFDRFLIDEGHPRCVRDLCLEDGRDYVISARPYYTL